MKKNSIFKYDVNFLEYPLWVIDQRNKDRVFEIPKDNGYYKIYSAGKLPTLLDIKVLYFLLCKIFQQSEFRDLEIKISTYEIAKNLTTGQNVSGSRVFKRIIHSLRKWSLVSIEFEGVFYEDKAHTTRFFGIIDDIVFLKKELYIRFNQQFMHQLQNSTFYKYLDFDDYKRFRSSLTLRLYELFSKNLLEVNDCFTIALEKLAQKLTLCKRHGIENYHPSYVLAKVRKSLSDLQKSGIMNVKLIYYKQQGICRFIQKSDQKKSILTRVKVEQQKEPKVSSPSFCIADYHLSGDIKENYLAYFKSLDEKRQEIIIQEIARDPFLRYLDSDNLKIIAYLDRIAKKIALQKS